MTILAPDPLAPVGDPAAFKNPDQAGFIRRFRDLVSTALLDRPSRSTATDFFLLNSPNGTPYVISVTNDGVLSAKPFTR